MPVVQVLETMKIRPDHVYVIPSDRQLSMFDGSLRVAQFERPRRGHVAIDIFFRTLAEVHRERSVAIVLPPPGEGEAPIAHATVDTDSTRVAEEAPQRVMSLLLTMTGHDFRQYKRATVLRRIERRLQVRGVHSLPEYCSLAESDAREPAALLADMPARAAAGRGDPLSASGVLGNALSGSTIGLTLEVCR